MVWHGNLVSTMYLSGQVAAWQSGKNFLTLLPPDDNISLTIAMFTMNIVQVRNIKYCLLYSFVGKHYNPSALSLCIIPQLHRCLWHCISQYKNHCIGIGMGGGGGNHLTSSLCQARELEDTAYHKTKCIIGLSHHIIMKKSQINSKLWSIL